MFSIRCLAVFLPDCELLLRLFTTLLSESLTQEATLADIFKLAYLRYRTLHDPSMVAQYDLTRFWGNRFFSDPQSHFYCAYFNRNTQGDRSRTLQGSLQKFRAYATSYGKAHPDDAKLINYIIQSTFYACVRTILTKRRDSSEFLRIQKNS